MHNTCVEAHMAGGHSRRLLDMQGVSWDCVARL
jgi:hypothetical protein